MFPEPASIINTELPLTSISKSKTLLLILPSIKLAGPSLLGLFPLGFVIVALPQLTALPVYFKYSSDTCIIVSLVFPLYAVIDHFKYL